MMRYPANQGQALSEYGLIACLVGLVVVSALLYMGQSLTGAMVGMVNTSSSADASTGSGGLMSGSTGAAGSGAGLGVGVGAGLQSNADALKAAYQNSVQVSGANGSQILANTQMLETVAGQYEQSNPEVANLLHSLAQLGQQMGDSMQLTITQDITHQTSQQVTDQVPKTVYVTQTQQVARTTKTSTPTASSTPILDAILSFFGLENGNSSQPATVYDTVTTQVPTTVYEAIQKTVIEQSKEAVQSADKDAIQAAMTQFEALWSEQVVSSAQYKALSPADQALVKKLVEDNIRLALAAVATMPTSSGAAQTKSNSTQIGVCGDANGCNGATASSGKG